MKFKDSNDQEAYGEKLAREQMAGSLLLYPKKTERAFARIRRERVNQDRKWGEQNHSWDYWLGILVEEVGELAKAIIERDSVNMDEELTQVAAVAVSMMEYGDRKGFQSEKTRDKAKLTRALKKAEEYKSSVGALINVLLGKSFAAGESYYVRRCNEVLEKGQDFDQALTEAREV